MTYKRSTVLTLKSFLLFFLNFGSTPKNLHLVAQVLPNSNLNFKPCCGIRNPRKFCLWNPESWVLESGIQIKESGIPITIGIQNSTVLQKNTGIQYLESGIHSVESRIQDCAGLFPYMGWRMSIYNYIHTEIYSLKSYDVNFLITWIFEPQALSSTNYFSMSILRRSVTVGEIILFIDVSLACDQGGAALSPSSGHPSARFFYMTPFFAFFPHCGAWSQG